MIKRRVESVHLDKIETNPVQPPGRAGEGKMLSDLAGSIKTYGVLDPPAVAEFGRRYIALNGHRRISACKLLGYTSIPCRIIPVGSVDEASNMFAEIDRVTKKLTGRDRFYGWAMTTDRDGYLKSLSGNQASVIRRFVSIFGVAESERYAKRFVDPGIVSSIQTAGRFMSLFTKEKWPPSLAKIGGWLITHKSSVIVRHVVSMGGAREAARLLRCIVEDKPYEIRKRPAKTSATSQANV